MGNVTENQEIRSNSYLFAVSTESSYITCQMVQLIVRRWKEYGKPLFLLPKDFKERILTSGMD
jgi:hypothetical protein